MENGFVKRTKAFGVDIHTLTQFWQTEGMVHLESQAPLWPDSGPGQGPGGKSPKMQIKKMQKAHGPAPMCSGFQNTIWVVVANMKRFPSLH